MSLFFSIRRFGCIAPLFVLFACSCSKQPDVSARLGGSPPGAIGQNDPRWKGIPEEYGDERGAIFSKKKYVKPGAGK